MSLKMAFLNLSVAILGMSLLGPNPSSTFAQAPAVTESSTEDVIHMVDGRVFRGQILSETRDQVVLEYRDTAINMTTKLALKKADIAKIERDLPSQNAPAAAPSDDEPTDDGGTIESAPTSPSVKKIDPNVETGMRFARTDNADVPSFYLVPMRGQMGTDIRSEVYDAVIQEIKQIKPTVVILNMECSDTTDLMFPDGYAQLPDAVLEEKRRREWGMVDFDNYREMVGKFRDGLRDFPQVVWIKDSDGIAATVAMAWDKLYLAPGGRLGATIAVLDRAGVKGIQDPDVRAKMIAANMGIAQSFLERGGYSPALAQAMLDSTPLLSGNWRGRTVEWQMDDAAQYVVDSSKKHCAYFNAKTAEDFCISQGIAATLDDLALLLGYREYRVLEAKAADGVDSYVADWRRLYNNCEGWLEEVDQYMGWASGQDAVKYLGKAKTTLERILSAIERYKAVELRMEADFGVDKTSLISQIEQIKEQLRSLKNRGGGGGGRTGGGGGGRIGPGSPG